MTEIQTTTTDDCIEATTDTATLRVDIGVVDSRADETLLAHTKQVAGVLLATPDAEAASTDLTRGRLELRAGETFPETGIAALHDELDALVGALVETYFHVKLDAGAPDHYQQAATDGGEIQR